MQLVLDDPSAPYAAMAGRDATRRVEVYGGWRVGDGGPAPFALELDGSEGYQDLFVVLSERALSEAEVRRAVAGQVPGLTVKTLRFPKR